MAIPAKTKTIFRFLLIALIIYAIIIVTFAWFYYSTSGIGFYQAAIRSYNNINLQKAIYFSVVSFHTIGYGDIYPVSNQGRMILMIQSFVSLFYTSVFSGLLVYFILKRHTDIFTTKYIYIRMWKECLNLSIRLGNKNRTIIDLKGGVEAWVIRDNTRLRIFRYHVQLGDLERILYVDVNLDTPENAPLRLALREALKGGETLYLSYSLIGNDFKSGEQVALRSNYRSDQIRFGKMFRNVYTWNKRGKRKHFRWSRFEQIEPLEEPVKDEFLSG